MESVELQPERLSARELEIARAYAGGANYRQIADRLYIAPTTVRTHISAIYRKLGVSTKIALLHALDKRTDDNGTTTSSAGPAATVGKRQVTILHVALDGIASIAGRTDPEIAASLAEEFHRVVTAAIARHGGEPLGGGTAEVSACFGVPVSDETDPERAVTCALEICGSVRGMRVRGSASMIARVGVCTGTVIGRRGPAEGLWGSTPVVAAALARATDGVVVCERTRAALGNLFSFEEQVPDGDHREPGAARRFSVIASSRSDTRFEALHGSRLSPLVGRNHQVGLLENLFGSARSGEGQVAIISGEAGIGKSRIVRALSDRLALRSEQSLIFQCSPHDRTSPLHPVAQTIRQVAGAERHDTASARLDSIVAAFNTVIMDQARDRQALAELASIHTEAPEDLQDLPPEKLRRRTLELLDRFLVGRAALGPLLLVFEDMHWSDPSTEMWLERIVQAVESLPVLVIVTCRPERTWTAGQAANVTTLALPRLGAEEVARIVADQAGVRALQPGLVARIVQRSEGNPLFAEELARAMLELGDAVDTVPTTLQASLMGRLDRLGAALEVAQAAAVIGRDFDRGLLEEVLADGRRPITGAIDALLASKLVVRRTIGDGLQFKHALVRDAAYDTLLNEQRETLHARAATALIARADAGGDIAPELIAHHLAKAGAPARSVPFWARAATQATRRSANHEAVSHIKNGLAALDALPDSEARERSELELQLALGTPLIAVSGYSGEATVNAFERARDLAERLANADGLFQALYGVWVNTMIRGEHRRARSTAEQLLSIALRSESKSQELTARRVLGWSLSLLGELEPGQRELETALSLFRREEHGGLYLRFGQDPRIAALAVLAWISCVLGDREKSRSLARDALSEASELGHSYSMAYATYIAGAAPCFLMGDLRAVHEHLDALMQLATDGHFPFWTGFGLGLRAALIAREGRIKESQTLASESFALLDSISVCWFRPFICSTLAESFIHVGEARAASKYVEAGLLLTEQTGERWIAPRIQRQQAELRQLFRPLHR